MPVVQNNSSAVDCNHASKFDAISSVTVPQKYLNFLLQTKVK